MADIYKSSAGSNTAPYDTWAKAATTLATAIAASSAGDTIYYHSETETISSDTTYTFPGTAASPNNLICSNDLVNEPPQTLGTTGLIDGTGTNGVDIYITGNAHIHGMEFKTGTAINNCTIRVAYSDEDFIFLHDCKITIAGTANLHKIYLGYGGAIGNTSIRSRGCTFSLGGATGQTIDVSGGLDSVGDVFTYTGTSAPNVLFGSGRGGFAKIKAADLSAITSTIMSGSTSQHFHIEIEDSKLGAGVTPLGTSSGVGHSDLTMRNCASGDTHYNFSHYDYLGNTVASTAIYANDGAQYDGTNYCSWVVTGTGATTEAPYVSPWILRYHSATASITPYLEILRDGSTTAYTDHEVWAEWVYQGTSGSPLGVHAADRGGFLSTPANQAAGVGLSGWTGESGTAWSGKLDTGSAITPAEIGHIQARVVVGGAYAVYVDPTIRGTT